jgi:serine/threonine protein kinase
MSVVYFCYDTAMGMPTVAKSLPPDKMANPSVHKRFLAECDLWVSLEKHPNVVKALYVESIDSTPFVFTEWIIGPENCFESSLADWLRQHGQTSVDFARTVALGVCEAFLHLAERFSSSRGTFSWTIHFRQKSRISGLRRFSTKRLLP